MKIVLLVILASYLLFGCAASVPAIASPTLRPSSTPQPSATFTPLPSPTETPFPISSLCSPLAGHSFKALESYITQGFTPPRGADWNNPEAADGGHHGVDIAYYQRNDEGGMGGHINGTPIQSVFDGYVAGFGFAETYGNYLIIETPFAQLPPSIVALYSVEDSESIYLLYAHMQDPAPFVPSEPIDCGQVIGAVGATGNEYFVVEPHLHLETRVGTSGIRLDPMNYYTTQATDSEKAQYRRWRNSDDFEVLDPKLLLDYGVQQEENNG